MINKYEKIPKATALRTRCAERTRTMQLACMCASDTCTVLFMGICVREDMEVQVWACILRKEGSDWKQRC